MREAISKKRKEFKDDFDRFCKEKCTKSISSEKEEILRKITSEFY